MHRTSLKDLKECLVRLGVKTGQTLIVHSSLLRFGVLEGGAKGVYQLLLEMLGPNGTLVMPAFTFAYGSSRIWDYHSTKSETGALTEFMRKQPDVIRTIHPFHSVVVQGSLRDEFGKCQQLSSFGRGSPFDLLHQAGAYNLSLGTDFEGGATFLHHTEEVRQVPYRMNKEFPGEVHLADGTLDPRTFRMFVRAIEPEYEYVNNWNRVWEALQQEQVFQVEDLQGAPVMLSHIPTAHAAFDRLLLANPFFAAEISNRAG
jgi:aminoglycoside 3-N-acetyltransferase